MLKPIRFSARICYWDEEKKSGLAVADIPAKYVEAVGGRRQMRVSGTQRKGIYWGDDAGEGWRLLRGRYTGDACCGCWDRR